jgi:RNA polymerase sigma factor
MEMSTEDDESSFNLYEIQNSMDSYHQTVQENELVEEILELSEVLSEFNVAFEELEHFSPKHRDTKEKLLEIADHFLQYSDLIEEFLKKKRLPVSAFLKKTGYHLKTIERHRKYLVTLIIVKLHPEWRRLSEYIQVSLGSEENHGIQNV